MRQRVTARRRRFSGCTIFVPLAIEAIGRLGPKALAYFNDNIADTHRRHGEEFLAKLSSTIAKWNARMVLDARAKMERRTR